MTDDDKPRLLVFPQEIPLDQELFEHLPLYAVKRFLECFDTLGEQKFSVPTHVLEELARRFLRLMFEEVGSLDEAFGGKVARQRNAMGARDLALPIIWDVLREQEAARKSSPFQRSGMSPLQCAFRAVAEARGMAESNVERIWKATKRRY